MYPTPDEDMRAIGNKLFEYVIRNIPKLVMAPTKDFDKVKKAKRIKNISKVKENLFFFQ